MKNTSFRVSLLCLLLAALMLLASCNTAPVSNGKKPTDDDTTTDTPTVSVDDPNTDPVTDSVTDPVTDPVTEPVTDPVTEPVTTPVIGPVEIPQPTPTPTPDPTIVYLPEQRVQIISMNVHNETTTVTARAPYMINMFRSFMPDSIGVQECGELWTEKLDAGLGDKYARVGQDVYGNETGGFATYIYYRKDRYRVVDDGMFWLSETPDVSSQYGPTVDMPRTCTWVILEDIQTGFSYVHLNTHLDRLDDHVEAIQMQMICKLMQYFERLGYPVYATGDFNNEEGNANYTLMVNGTGIKDSKKIATYAPQIIGTFSNYNVQNAIGKKAIDFCFVTGESTSVSKYLVLDQSYSENVYVSDHFAVYVDSTVKSLPMQTPVSTYKPAFSETATVSAKTSPSLAMMQEITFPQARCEDGTLAKHYRIEVYDSANQLIIATVAYAGMFRVNPANYVTATMMGGEKDVTYTVKITPVSLFDKAGETLQATFVWTATSLSAVDPGDAKIVNVTAENGLIRDTSTYQWGIDQYGSADIEGDEMIFTGNGNFYIPNFNNTVYSKLCNGFSIETTLTTGNDIQSTQGYISNKESGGFSLECGGGTLIFYVHNGESYVKVHTNVSKNTSYHVVCTFDENTLRLYLNGELAAETAFTGQLMSPESENSNYLTIGSDCGDTRGESFASVRINTVRIYDLALTYENVVYLYRAQ